MTQLDGSRLLAADAVSFSFGVVPLDSPDPGSDSAGRPADRALIVDPVQFSQELLAYARDATERSVLFWDTLRQRADNMLAHERAGKPALLDFVEERVVLHVAEVIEQGRRLRDALWERLFDSLYGSAGSTRPVVPEHQGTIDEAQQQDIRTSLDFQAAGLSRAAVTGGN